MSNSAEDEKYIRDAGWKLYSKDEGKKFWESPSDHRVYSTSHAVIAQQIADEEKREALRLAAMAHQQEGIEDLDRFLNWEEGTVEEIAPLPKKKRAIKKFKRSTKKSRSKTIHELGY